MAGTGIASRFLAGRAYWCAWSLGFRRKHAGSTPTLCPSAQAFGKPNRTGNRPAAIATETVAMRRGVRQPAPNGRLIIGNGCRPGTGRHRVTPISLAASRWLTAPDRLLRGQLAHLLSCIDRVPGRFCAQRLGKGKNHTAYSCMLYHRFTDHF